ncbi:hypothetical protein [Promicromonospora kroppenstedtii]|uniref:hypothetical protein n=1 Tax=Promicromonospora kroppenstedtii TaxID=440482 RepID=UPI00146FC61F|nr:hypothetical protein [Promicromonospora kroppenstedtii]
MLVKAYNSTSKRYFTRKFTHGKGAFATNRVKNLAQMPGIPGRATPDESFDRVDRAL